MGGDQYFCTKCTNKPTVTVGPFTVEKKTMDFVIRPALAGIAVVGLTLLGAMSDSVAIILPMTFASMGIAVYLMMPLLEYSEYDEYSIEELQGIKRRIEAKIAVLDEGYKKQVMADKINTWDINYLANQSGYYRSRFIEVNRIIAKKEAEAAAQASAQ